MTELERLAEKAKEAQRAYDKAKESKAKVAKDTIICTSKGSSFEWQCQATTGQVVAHTMGTIKAAMETLKEENETIALVLPMLALLSIEAKNENL